jgi:hypothetical protein
MTALNIIRTFNYQLFGLKVFETTYDTYTARYTKEKLQKCNLEQTILLLDYLEKMIILDYNSNNEENIKECIRNWHDRAGNLLLTYRKCPVEKINIVVRQLAKSVKRLEKRLVEDERFHCMVYVHFGEEEKHILALR